MKRRHTLLGLGGAGASLFAIGYTDHDAEPHRVAPFVPLFLAGMQFVVVAAEFIVFHLFVEVVDIEVGVDGGINASTAREALDAGARYLVAGSSVFAASIEGVRGAIDALRTSE